MAEIKFINTGRARVIINVNDTSFVNLFSEGEGAHISAYIPLDGSIVDKLGSTAERSQGFLEESDIGNWGTRLRNASFGQTAFSNPEDTNFGLSADWYSVQQYLLYGGNVVVGSTPDNFTNVLIDSMYSTSGNVSHVTNAMNSAMSTRGGDFVAIFPAGGSGSGVTAEELTPDTSEAHADKKIFVYGYKKHLGYERNATDDSKLITTSCAADVAGCLARTDREFAPYYSPAGFKRGRILDVIRLVQNPTETEQDRLYDANINPVVTFVGEGTFLFGDKTAKDEASTLSRINVSRLFIFLKRTIGRIARQFLFEFNDIESRSAFSSQATNVLRAIKADRGVFDFKVQCDESNNPPDKIDANIFTADVFVKPTKSVNFIQLTFTNKNQSDELN
jgi:hypothetical protein